MALSGHGPVYHRWTTGTATPIAAGAELSGALAYVASFDPEDLPTPEEQRELLALWAPQRTLSVA